MQQFSRPIAPALVELCFLSQPNIPEGQEYKKYQHYIDTWGDFTNTTQKQQLLTGLAILTELWYVYGMNLLATSHIEQDILTSSGCCCQATEDCLSAMCVRTDAIFD